MFRLTILFVFCLHCCHGYKQQPMSDYGGQSQQQSQPSAPLPKPQAIIHLPDNVYTHKITDTIKLDHEQLANYLSSINYLPDTIHKHAQLLAQIDQDQIKQYGQSIGPNQLPLISLTVPQDSKSSDYNSGDAQMKLNNEDYSAPQQQDYGGQSNSGYQAQPDSYNSQPQQGYEQQPQLQQGYGQQSQSPKKPCHHQSGNSGYQQQQQQQQGYGQQQQGYGQQQQQQNSGGYDQANSQEQYGGGNGASAGAYGNDGDSNEQNYNDGPQAPQVEYQGGQMENNYGGENSGGSGYDSGNSGNNYYSNDNGDNNSYENQDNGGQSYSNNNNNNNQNYGGNSNEDSGNYESSPFDFNFVSILLKHVMNQLEQLQIDPDSLNVYGKTDDSNGGGYNAGGGESQGNYESGNGAPQGYEAGYAQANKQGVQLYDRPSEGSNEMINYGYSVNHGSYERPNAGNYESGYTSSSTRSQATSYGANEPAVILDNKIPINSQENKDHPSTVTYQMPTINLELPKKQIEHIMKAISSKKGRYTQPIMIKASEFKLPSGLNLGKIKTIAFIKSSKLNGLNQLPYINSQLLDGSPSGLNSNADYKLMSATSKKEETKYESSPVLSAYGYGVSSPSSKLYASSSSNKKSIVLPLKSRSKRLGHSYSLQTASSNLKKSIISALPKISKKATPTAAVSSSSTVVEKK